MAMLNCETIDHRRSWRGVGQRVRLRSHRRQGYTLVLFVMLMFGIMAMAALVIDIGFARLTQRQMQTAADAAALEGLRFRDELPPGSPPPTSLEEGRRQQASNIVAWTFDEDWNSVASDSDTVPFGAGPVIEFVEGGDPQLLGDPQLNANQTINGLSVFKPTRSDGTRGLELNLSDEIHGDMLAGEYIADAEHNEAANYDRSDLLTPDDSGFLVRMRRRHDDFDVVDTDPGVSSKGPEIPYLFGRGALLPPADPSAGYSPRHHGMTVRATAIAGTKMTQDNQPIRVGNVTLVGPAFPNQLFDPNFNGIYGVAPFLIDVSSWPPGTSTSFVIDSDGRSLPTGEVRLTRVTKLQGPLAQAATTASVSLASGFPAAPFKARVGLEIVNVTFASGTTWTITRGVDGTAASSHSADSPVVLHKSMSIGTLVSDIQSGERIDQLDSLESGTHRYVPLFSGSPERVVGFGFAQAWSWDALSTELAVQGTVGGTIADANASASLRHVSDVSDALSVLS